MSHRLCDIQLFHSDHRPTQSIYDYRQTARDIWQELDGEVEPWWRCCLLAELSAAERRCGVCLCRARAARGHKRLFQAGAEDVGTTTSLRFGTLRSSRFLPAGLDRRFYGTRR